jgi:hypothetical protein
MMLALFQSPFPEYIGTTLELVFAFAFQIDILREKWYFLQMNPKLN